MHELTYLNVEELAFAMARRHSRILSLSAEEVPDRVLDNQARADLEPYIEEARALFEEIERIQADPAIISGRPLDVACAYEDRLDSVKNMTRIGMAQETKRDAIRAASEAMAGRGYEMDPRIKAAREAAGGYPIELPSDSEPKD